MHRPRYKPSSPAPPTRVGSRKCTPRLLLLLWALQCTACRGPLGTCLGLPRGKAPGQLHWKRTGGLRTRWRLASEQFSGSPCTGAKETMVRMGKGENDDKKGLHRAWSPGVPRGKQPGRLGSKRIGKTADTLGHRQIGSLATPARCKRNLWSRTGFANL